MNIQEFYQYNEKTQEVVGPFNRLLVILARGLFVTPIYFSFSRSFYKTKVVLEGEEKQDEGEFDYDNKRLTKNDIEDIIDKLYDQDMQVVAISGDMA